MDTTSNSPEDPIIPANPRFRCDEAGGSSVPADTLAITVP